MALIPNKKQCEVIGAIVYALVIAMLLSTCWLAVTMWRIGHG